MVFIVSRRNPLSNGIPAMSMGHMPRDGGNLLLTQEERDLLIKHEPEAKKYIRRFSMGEEFINNTQRYCLWLVNCTAEQLKKMPLVTKRVNQVRKWRLQSKAESTRKKAETAAIFGQITKMEKSHHYITVPKISSARRAYVPIGFLDKSYIPGDKLFVIPAGGMYHFGMLTSVVHMAWIRAVCGRLGGGYSYSNTTVYNNFPWPNVSEKQKAAIETLAQGVLDARAKFPESSLADLYDPQTMPPELLKSHEKLDRAVMKLYGFGKDTTEPQIVEELMKRYQQMIVTTSAD